MIAKHGECEGLPVPYSVGVGGVCPTGIETLGRWWRLSGVESPGLVDMMREAGLSAV